MFFKINNIFVNFWKKKLFENLVEFVFSVNLIVNVRLYLNMIFLFKNKNYMYLNIWSIEE